jgi:hypothetical protein
VTRGASEKERGVDIFWEAGRVQFLGWLILWTIPAFVFLGSMV